MHVSVTKCSCTSQGTLGRRHTPPTSFHHANNLVTALLMCNAVGALLANWAEAALLQPLCNAETVEAMVTRELLQDVANAELIKADHAAREAVRGSLQVILVPQQNARVPVYLLLCAAQARADGARMLAVRRSLAGRGAGVPRRGARVSPRRE